MFYFHFNQNYQLIDDELDDEYLSKLLKIIIIIIRLTILIVFLLLKWRSYNTVNILSIVIHWLNDSLITKRIFRITF